MKKIIILGILPIIFLVTGCGNKKIEITNTKSLKEYKAESCNKYFEIADCVIEKENDPTRTDEMRKELRQEIVEQQQSRSGQNRNIIEKNCKGGLDSFYEIKDHLIEIGCNID